MNPLSDASHCGACGRACPVSATCSSGSCACPPGSVSDGRVCRSLRYDPVNCGRVGNACRADQVCSAGACVCRPGLTPGGGGTFCTDLQSSPNNCGGLGRRCNSNQACLRGGCVGERSCTSPNTECSGWCVDLRTHPFHCGSCGRACARNEVCAAGSCKPYYAVNPCLTCPCTGCRSIEICCATPDRSATTCVDGARCP